MALELPDEAITYNYQGLLVPAGEDWTAAAELRAHHFLLPQMLMLATVIEGRLMGINPYSQPAAEAHKRSVRELLRTAEVPAAPKG
jgi:hypothetical protein